MNVEMRVKTDDNTDIVSIIDEIQYVFKVFDQVNFNCVNTIFFSFCFCIDDSDDDIDSDSDDNSDSDDDSDYDDYDDDDDEYA